MNVPNKLTLSRILLIPAVLALQWAKVYPAALAVFAVAAFTDFLDGYLARKNNQITVFGKFADPVADKLLVLCSMIVLAEHGLMPSWPVCIVAARELAVDGLRLVAAGKNKVVAASMAGKIKTNLQLLCVILCMIRAFAPMPEAVILIVCALMSAATVYSGFLYFRDLKDVFKEQA